MVCQCSSPIAARRAARASRTCTGSLGSPALTPAKSRAAVVEARWQPAGDAADQRLAPVERRHRRAVVARERVGDAARRARARRPCGLNLGLGVEAADGQLHAVGAAALAQQRRPGGWRCCRVVSSWLATTSTAVARRRARRAPSGSMRGQSMTTHGYAVVTNSNSARTRSTSTEPSTGRLAEASRSTPAWSA